MKIKKEKITGKVFNLKCLIDYQKNSVVSKTLISKKVGTITVFAFDKGQGLSEHVAPYDAMIIVMDGQAEIHINGKPFSVESGEMIILPANIPHALKALKKFKMLLIMIRS